MQRRTGWCMLWTPRTPPGSTKPRRRSTRHSARESSPARRCSCLPTSRCGARALDTQVARCARARALAVCIARRVHQPAGGGADQQNAEGCLRMQRTHARTLRLLPRVASRRLAPPCACHAAPANKQDVPGAGGLQEVAEALGLGSADSRPFIVQPACAASGAGLREGLSWLVEAAKRAPRRHAVAAAAAGGR